MSSVYDKLVEAIEAGNYNQIIEILTTTPLGDYLLKELEEQGFRKEEILSAVARGALTQIQSAAIEMVINVNNFSSLLKEKKYLDAIKLIKEKPNIVNAINLTQGTSYSADDLLASLIYHALKAGQKPSDGIAYKKGLASYLLELVSNEIKSNNLQKAVNIISENLNTFVEVGYSEVIKNALLVIFNGAVETGDDNTCSQSIELLKKLGVISEDEIKEIEKIADQLMNIFSEETTNIIVKEVNNAIKSGDPNVIMNVANQYKDILQKTPLAIDNIDTGITIYEYMVNLSIYLQKIEPMFHSIFEILTQANDNLQKGNYQGAISSAKKVMEIIETMKTQADIMALLMLVNVTATTKQAIGRREALKKVDEILKVYEDNAELITVIAKLGEKYDPTLMPQLYRYAKTDKGVAEIYASLSFQYEAGVNDIEAVLDGKTTSLLLKIKDLGIEPIEYLKSRPDLTRALVLRAVGNCLITSNFEKAKGVAEKAVKIGLNSELTKVAKAIAGVEQSIKIIQNINNIMSEISKSPSSSSFLMAKLTALRSNEAELEKVSNMPEIDVFQTKDGQPFSSSLKASLSYVKDLDRIVESYVKVISGFEAYSDCINQLTEGKISEETFFNKIFNNVLPLFDDGRKILGAISTQSLKKPAEDYQKKITPIITELSTIAIAVNKYGEINRNINMLITTLRDGLQFPEEAKKVTNLWFTATISLKSLNEMAQMPQLTDKTIGWIKNIYQEYLKYLSQLKTDLVKSDLRLEDLLNIAEQQSGLSIQYEKPYFAVPVIGTLEKLVKIGIQQAADWLGRIPAIGSVTASFWKGFANIVTALVQPWEIWTEIQYIIGGINPFFEKIIRGDFKGAWEQIVAPLSKFFTEDPAYAVGVILGAIFMAKVGELIVKKFKLPLASKELIINILQGDPLGLAIAYIATPITKYVIKLIRGLVTPAGVKFDISGIERMRDAIFDNVEKRVAVSTISVKRFYDFLKKYAKTVEDAMKTIEDVIEKKGVGYTRALRDSLYDAVSRATKSIDDINRLVETVSDMASTETVLKVGASIENMTDVNRAIRELNTVLTRFKNTFNIDIPIDKILEMDVNKINKITSVLKNVVTDIRNFSSKIQSSLKNMLDEIRKTAPEANIETIDRALLDYNMGNTSAIFKALDEFNMIIKTINPDDATALLHKFINDLKSKGLADIASNLEKTLNDIELPKSKVLETVKTSILQKAESAIKELYHFPEIRHSIDNLVSNIQSGNLSLVVKFIDQLSDSLSELSKATKNIDVLSTLSTLTRQITDAIEDIRKSVIGLGLDKFDFYKKMLKELDKISSKINVISEKVKETSLAIKVGIDVSEVAKRLGFEDISEKLLKEQIDVNEAISEIRKRLLTESIDKIAPSLKTLDKLLTEMFKEPALYTVRMMLMNIIDEVKGEISNLRVSKSIVESLNEILSRYGEKLTPEAVSEIKRAINEPTIANVSKVVDMIGYNPVLASAIDLTVFTKMIDNLAREIEELSATVKSDIASTIVNKLENIKKYVLGSDVIVERYAIAGLIDPSFTRVFSEALDDLKQIYPLLGDKIDIWKKTVVDFINKVNAGDVKGALAIGKELDKAISKMRELVMQPQTFSKIREFFSNIKDKIENAIKKSPFETENLRALREFSDKIVRDVNEFSTIEPGGFGYIISDVEEVVGRGIKTPADYVPEVRKFLEIKDASLKFTIDGYEISATRTASLLPTEVSVKYTFQLPSGGNMYVDVVARPLKVSGEVINSIYTYIYYDPTSLTDPAAKAIVELSKSGIDLMNKIDPEGARILPKILVVTDFGTMPMSSIIGKALNALAISLGVTLNISRLEQLPKPEGALYMLYLQEKLEPVFEKLRDIAIPTPENIASELMEKGINPISYIPELNIVMGDVADATKITIDKIKVIELLDIGKIATITIKTSGGELQVMPIPKLIEKTKVNADELLQEIKKIMPEISIEEITIPIQTLPQPPQTILAPPPIIHKPRPAPQIMPTPPQVSPATAGGLQVMTIGGRVTFEKLQY
ncbi:MAG: hypothetical protein QXK24_01240 [Ignisphaera sp.]